ncbi:hypothetical protein ACEPAF_7470 [Sanghuangporus sanghuang]
MEVSDWIDTIVFNESIALVSSSVGLLVGAQSVHTLLANFIYLQLFLRSRGTLSSFLFTAGHHGVTQSGEISDPCSPLRGGFNSGIVAIFFYCAATSPSFHCANGMVGAINAEPDQYTSYSLAAKSVTVIPTQVTTTVLSGVGAVATAAPFTPTPSAILTSTAASSSDSDTPSLTATSSFSALPSETSASSSKPSSNNAAAIGGGIGGGVAICIIALLGFLLLRSRRNVITTSEPYRNEDEEKFDFGSNPATPPGLGGFGSRNMRQGDPLMGGASPPALQYSQSAPSRRPTNMEGGSVAPYARSTMYTHTSGPASELPLSGGLPGQEFGYPPPMHSGPNLSVHAIAKEVASLLGPQLRVANPQSPPSGNQSGRTLPNPHDASIQENGLPRSPAPPQYEHRFNIAVCPAEVDATDGFAATLCCIHGCSHPDSAFIWVTSASCPSCSLTTTMTRCKDDWWRQLSILASLLFSVSAVDLGSPTEYAPQVNIPCPDAPLVRVFTPENQTLNALEQEYISNREATVIPDAWQDWIGDGSALGYNMSIFNNEYPRVGIAISGGGYRAAQLGAGVLLGYDARDELAKKSGTGGFLQVASYITGLSGGSWVTGSMFFNDWPKIPDLVFGNGGNLSGWILDLNLAAPYGTDLFDKDNQYFFGSILWSVVAKANKSLDTSLTDPWSRMISYHFLNGTSRDNFFTNDSSHGAGQLWSRIPEIPSFQQHLTPFPLIVVNSRPVGSNLTTVLTPEPIVYEVTPAEFGSWDPNLSAMVNLTYAGTHFSNGQPPNDTSCVTGFDQAGFVMGTSASLFNQILDFAHNELQDFSNNDASSLLYVLSRQLTEVRTRADDVANWPNPFQSLKPDTFEDSNSTWLDLIDGSSNLENVPLGALFVKARGLDVILGLDSSADDPTFRWPNGTSIIFSQRRITNLLSSSHQAFPPIPSSTSDFISTGVNQRITFFGCDPQNETVPEYPLLIYLPNNPPANGDDPVTNTNTFKIQYTEKHSKLFIDQARNLSFSGFNPNILGADPSFGTCFQCAAIDRARYKSNPVIPRSDICTNCFKQYCFNPDSPPSSSAIIDRKYTFVDPDPQGVNKVQSFFSRHKAPIIAGAVGLVVIIIASIFMIRSLKAKKEAKYKRLSVLANESDAPWKAYSERLGSFELSGREHK